MSVSSSHSNHSKRAILNACVSSAEQVEGYSLDQEIDALRAWVSQKGYKVLAEVRGEG